MPEIVGLAKADTRHRIYDKVASFKQGRRVTMANRKRLGVGDKNILVRLVNDGQQRWQVDHEGVGAD
jgi:hypothetical protein